MRDEEAALSDNEKSPFDAPVADPGFPTRFQQSALATHNLAFALAFIALAVVSLTVRKVSDYRTLSGPIEFRGIPPWLEIAEGSFLDVDTGATFQAGTISSINWLNCAINLILITILSAVVRRYFQRRHAP